jgi:transposase
MTNQITPDVQAKILSAIKDDGLSIADAAKNYNFTKDTIKKWLRGSANNASFGSRKRVCKQGVLTMVVCQQRTSVT